MMYLLLNIILCFVIIPLQDAQEHKTRILFHNAT